jgi:type III restriction enzyme
MLENGRLPLFRNFDESGNRLPRPQTLLEPRALNLARL